MANMRRVEIMEEKLLDGEQDYYKGDIKSFPEEKATYWISLGWAKDVDTGEIGERTPGAAPVVPNTVVTNV